MTGSPPPVRIELPPDRAWRAAVAAAALLATGLCGAGLMAEPASAPARAAWAAGAVLAGGLGALAWRSPAATLAWDGRCWRLLRHVRADEAGEPGDVAVAIDLGGWMLLRFTPAQPGGSMRTDSWWPASRRAAGERWHLLRCAVYSPRFRSGAGPATDSPPPE